MRDFAGPNAEDPTSPSLGIRAVWAGVGCGVVTSVFGMRAVAAILGILGGLVASEIRWRALRKRQEIAAEDEFPEALEALAEAVRAKGSLRLGIEELARTAPRSIAPAFQHVYRLLEQGFSLEESLVGLFSIRGVPGGSAMELALKTHIRAGGNLSAALEALSASVRQRISIRRELEALTAQARMSALVLAAAPAGFAGLSYILGLGGHFLFSSPLGAGVLTAGLLLEAFGYLWVRRVCARRW